MVDKLATSGEICLRELAARLGPTAAAAVRHQAVLKAVGVVRDARRVAAENATGGNRPIDYGSVPNVIFTRPEVAGVGLTEAEACRRGANVKVSQFPFSANPKARIYGESDGLVRLICEADSGRLLGVHLMGPHATDMISEGALAVQAGLTADDLAWRTHAHPTLPEAMLEAALGFRGTAVHAHSR